jgi:hypothetical protein
MIVENGAPASDERADPQHFMKAHAGLLKVRDDVAILDDGCRFEM